MGHSEVAEVVTSKLTDGSTVYDVELEVGGGTVVFHAIDEQAAVKVCAKLAELWAWHIVGAQIKE